VTTHWMFADAFRKRFPGVDMDADKIVIDDGDIVTAGGLMAWTDLGMRLIERMLGQSVMIETGQFFLIDVGGREQRHYSTLAPDVAHGDDAIALVQTWLRQTGAKDVSVAAMAEKAGMEERTFLRHFKAATGTTPREYAQRMKFDRARKMLQTTRQPVSRIAWDIGYGDAAAFGRQFHRFVGLSPGEYRRRFAVAGDGGPTQHTPARSNN
jgi:transcriptional regulator GlxA family with amidase domain